jgi:hypothetical protein
VIESSEEDETNDEEDDVLSSSQDSNGDGNYEEEEEEEEEIESEEERGSHTAKKKEKTVKKMQRGVKRTKPKPESLEQEEEDEEAEETDSEMEYVPKKKKREEKKIVKCKTGKKAVVLHQAKKDEGKKPKKNLPPEIAVSSKVRDVSRPSAELIKDKFLLGDRYSVQVGQINIRGKNYNFESLIFMRDAPPDNPDGKKPFTFNIPSKLIPSLKVAIDTIVSRMEKKTKSAAAGITETDM